MYVELNNFEWNEISAIFIKIWMINMGSYI